MKRVTTTEIINGVEYTFQSVDAQSYFDAVDKYKEKTFQLFDWLLRNAVVSPANFKSEGARGFGDDIGGIEAVGTAIITFLKEPHKSDRGEETSEAK